VSSYQVIARKWRPQRFDDVIGQRGVTQTLRNAIGAGRIAQSFVFSGPRGVGKTTTARILARALNCEKGPTADPCGECDACVEIAQGRDMDVLEIDAATNTQVDKVREVIIAGLGMAPVRNKYKIFIIDEVHRLSQQAFDALLKSIEEPPPHFVFMMATTEIEKVPATIQSRSQVFELKTIAVKAIVDQLRRIVDAEGIQVDDAALILVARAGDGSMRDAQSALDQVIAFAGSSLSVEDVATVLGLVRRDLLIEIAARLPVLGGDSPDELDPLLPDRWLLAHPQHRWVIDELRRSSRRPARTRHGK
jgi:DNA polymerase-3 subunit gamma/tau